MGPAVTVFLLVPRQTPYGEYCVFIADKGARWSGERRLQSSDQWWGTCSQQVPRSYVLVTQDGWWRRSEKVGLQEISTTGTIIGFSIGLENVGIERDDLVAGPGLETVKWGSGSGAAAGVLLYCSVQL